MNTLDPRKYTVAWLAPLEIEARAARCMLDTEHQGRFPRRESDDHTFNAGEIGDHNVVIATFPPGTAYGTGSAADLARAVKSFFPNVRLALLVGIAAGMPDLRKTPSGYHLRDIRLGDVLVAMGSSNSSAVIPYDLGKSTTDGLKLLRHGHGLPDTQAIIRSAIGEIQREEPEDLKLFVPYYEAMKNKRLPTSRFTRDSYADPGLENDRYYRYHNAGGKIRVDRPDRPANERTRVWYGTIGSGEKVIKNEEKREDLVTVMQEEVIGLEMEAAGTLRVFPAGVIQGVCDYGNDDKNDDWQPFAAAMAAAYAKAVLMRLYEVDREPPLAEIAPEPRRDAVAVPQ
ncbi:ankyrin repeat-containing protein [Colletotrichum limetticola]|uniref:Ankyrin repeat-containing protein n=1 Tax=Colletotrichum limetticola TaxID=1209924 RepID=A0ABQ9PGQ4_9PEZI|nr:ankyrin repeat-containing protein [Colletotrichum limetticola]